MDVYKLGLYLMININHKGSGVTDSLHYNSMKMLRMAFDEFLHGRYLRLIITAIVTHHMNHETRGVQSDF